MREMKGIVMRIYVPFSDNHRDESTCLLWVSYSHRYHCIL